MCRISLSCMSYNVSGIHSFFSFRISTHRCYSCLLILKKNEIHNTFQCFFHQPPLNSFQKCLMFLVWQICAQGWEGIFSIPSILKARKKSSSGLLVYEILSADNYSWFNMHLLLSEGKVPSAFGKISRNMHSATLSALRMGHVHCPWSLATTKGRN